MPEVDLPSFESDGSMAAESNSTGEALVSVSEGKGLESKSSSFILNLLLSVVPAWLVERMLKVDFVGMAELLWDNIEAERRRAQFDLETGSPVISVGLGDRAR